MADRVRSALKAILIAVLPERAWRGVQALATRLRDRRRGLRRRPPVGWVRFGSLRRVRPIDPDFGFRWGQVIDRYYIERFLEAHARDIRGHALEVGGDDYVRQFGGARVARCDVLHRTAGNPAATIVADLSRAPQIPDQTFDVIVLTQTLQFIYDIQGAVGTLHRILRPGGVLLATAHGISQVSRADMDQWGEYWRLTSLSARRIAADIFGSDGVTVQAYGNVLTATAFLHGLTAQELRREELEHHDPNFEVILGIRARRSLPDS